MVKDTNKERDRWMKGKEEMDVKEKENNSLNPSGQNTVLPFYTSVCLLLVNAVFPLPLQLIINRLHHITPK